MMRYETKRDKAKREAAALKKNPTPKVNSSTTSHPFGYSEAQSYSYVSWQDQDKRRAEEREAKKAEDAAYAARIESLQDEEDAFTPADLYEAGLEERSEGNGLMAVTRLWQALVCGVKEAAFPLFEMLLNGEGEVAQNIEMAGLVLYTGKIVDSPECLAQGKSIKSPGHDVCRTLSKVCFYSQKHITPGKKITDVILEERQREANAALDQFKLVTRSHEEMMEEVFAHNPEMNARLEEIALAGQVEQEEHHDTGGKKCVVM